MIKSMTGYGRADHDDAQLRISAEVKAINAKYVEVHMRLPSAFLMREIAWRNLAIACLERGTITISVTCESKGVGALPAHLNTTLFRHYYHTLQTLAEEVGASSQALFQLALQAPEVLVKAAQAPHREQDYLAIEKVIRAALKQCNESRQAEGAVLSSKLSDYVKIIRESWRKLEGMDTDRKQAVKQRLQVSAVPWVTAGAIDKVRLEQEFAYYLERLDITEEKVRLARHLSYFEEVMEDTQAVGKKLGFIAQEIGREINVIGAKANDAVIQKEVIQMKDALEKVKEQLQNIL